MWKSKWRVRAETEELINKLLQEQIDDLSDQVDYFKEREQRAVAALLDIQGKPALERPDSSGAMEFLDKSFSLFNDTQGGEEVA